MKTSHVACTVLISATAGFLGYWLHGQIHDSGAFAAAKALPQLDYLVVEESFSRIENSRRNLEGLCTRLRLEVENRLVDHQRQILKETTSSEAADARLDRIIRDLETGMKELDGTDQQLLLAEDLFCALKRAGRYSRWVDVYLQALYNHPTHPTIASFAAQALQIGKLAGREDDVLTGLRHLSAIPVDFEGKQKIEEVLIATARGNHVAQAKAAMNPVY